MQHQPNDAQVRGRGHDKETRSPNSNGTQRILAQMTYLQRSTQLFFFTAVLSLGSFGWSQSAPSEAEILRWRAQAKQVEIIRDTYGVPHIYGKTDADVVFGLMYAQCEDDFNRVETNFLTATGRLAEAQGFEGLYSDLRARLWMTDQEAQDQYNTAPAWLKEL